jgi:hypothetical protein
MRKSIVAAAFAALLLVAIPSTSSAQVVVGSYGTPVYSYSYTYPTYTYSYVPVYSYPAYPVYSYPAYSYYPSYGGFSVGFGYYPHTHWGGYYGGGWGRHYGGWGGHYGGFHGGGGGHHHR